jgi:hypothetical protein
MTFTLARETFQSWSFLLANLQFLTYSFLQKLFRRLLFTMPFLQRLSTIVALLPLVHSAAIEVFPRGQILKDVIRFQKCEKLTKPDGWERNQIGYWKDWDSKGAPDDHAQTDMYTKTDDYFYNGKGNDYGGITTYGMITCSDKPRS